MQWQFNPLFGFDYVRAYDPEAGVTHNFMMFGYLICHWYSFI